MQEQLDKLEESMGAQLPLDVRCSLRIHNGQKVVKYCGVFGGYEFYSHQASLYYMGTSSKRRKVLHLLFRKLTILNFFFVLFCFFLGFRAIECFLSSQLLSQEILLCELTTFCCAIWEPANEGKWLNWTLQIELVYFCWERAGQISWSNGLPNWRVEDTT